ncbi:hypothetical protein [Flammeovirga pacifica]|uniref:Uncharacterized protein n=1 Tax=Flammeovirga pacifica TaxID=915059 RepID=A0A1S1YT27_FLAPC|nr:hypothetical protein [Flammeovirga pacifica]OHX64013.1 hypothetical protein NH26_20605 [Flammeovirga pacifica]
MINWEVAPDELKVTYQDETLRNLFQIHIDRFIEEAQKRDITFRSGKVNIKWGDLEDHVNATTFSNGIIRINLKSIKIKHEHLALQLISHELYHLLCQPPSNYDHRNRDFIAGTSYVTSLMVASSKKEEFPALNELQLWDYYYDEMFLFQSNHDHSEMAYADD